jgi:hypothetical protein
MMKIAHVRLVELTYLFSGRKIIWAPLAFANRHLIARNDTELVCASLAATP